MKENSLLFDLKVVLINTFGLAMMSLGMLFALVLFLTPNYPLFALLMAFEVVIGLMLVAYWKSVSGGTINKKKVVPIDYIVEEIEKLKNESADLSNGSLTNSLKARSMMITAYDYEILLKEWAHKNKVSLKAKGIDTNEN